MTAAEQVTDLAEAQFERHVQLAARVTGMTPEQVREWVARQLADAPELSTAQRRTLRNALLEVPDPPVPRQSKGTAR